MISVSDRNSVSQFVDAFFRALEDSRKAHPPQPNTRSNTEWRAEYYSDYIAVFHGDEIMAKLSVEDANDLCGELALALEKRGENRAGE